MPKILAILGMVVGSLLAVLFGVDMFAAMPFGTASFAFDVTAMVCGLILAILAFLTLRELQA